MKIGSKNKLKRIALISVAAAVTAACSPLPVYAAALPEQSVKVVYTGDGTTKAVDVENAKNLDTFLNLMPNTSTPPQDIYIVNKSSKQMKVYFRAVPESGEQAAALLRELNLKITFQMDDTGKETVLYDGKASGNASNAVDGTNSKQVTDITKSIPLGFVYGNTTSGVLRATLAAPETMDNTFAGANASIKWVFQFELADPAKPSGGGGGGGGTPGGSGVEGVATSIPVESISPDGTPQGGPTISAVPITEVIPNENVPLSKPPKTGESSAFLWIALVAALVGCVGFAASRGRMNSSK